MQRKDPDYEPKEWVHNGHLVLDRDDRPIIHYRNIPAVVSSEFPSYAVEAIQRIDSRITLRDILAFAAPTGPINPTARAVPAAAEQEFYGGGRGLTWKFSGMNGVLDQVGYEIGPAAPAAPTCQAAFAAPTARMPITIKRKNGKDSVVKDNAITQRTHRFRLKAGCVAWKERRGSKVLEEFLNEHLPPELKKANTTLGFRDLTSIEFLDEHFPLELKNGNSTRGFRDLTRHEMKRLEKANSDHFPKKRGSSRYRSRRSCSRLPCPY